MKKEKKKPEWQKKNEESLKCLKTFKNAFGEFLTDLKIHNKKVSQKRSQNE